MIEFSKYVFQGVSDLTEILRRIVNRLIFKGKVKIVDWETVFLKEK